MDERAIRRLLLKWPNCSPADYEKLLNRLLGVLWGYFEGGRTRGVINKTSDTCEYVIAISVTDEEWEKLKELLNRWIYNACDFDYEGELIY